MPIGDNTVSADRPMPVPIDVNLWRSQTEHHAEQARAWADEIKRLEDELSYANACFRVNTVAAEKAHEMADLVMSNLEDHNRYQARDSAGVSEPVRGEVVPPHLLRG